MKREKRVLVLTSKDFTEVFVDFEPVRQHAKCEEEDGKAEQEDPHKHARGEPDLTGERRDEMVLRKAVVSEWREHKLVPPVREVHWGRKHHFGHFTSL